MLYYEGLCMSFFLVPPHSLFYGQMLKSEQYPISFLCRQLFKVYKNLNKSYLFTKSEQNLSHGAFYSESLYTLTNRGPAFPKEQVFAPYQILHLNQMLRRQSQKRQYTAHI